jgi:hypothetical protein
MIINEVTENSTTVTGSAGQQNSTEKGTWNPYTRQFQLFPSESNHFQTAASLLHEQRTSETSHSATHENWLRQQTLHVSNTDEALDIELAKLSVPEQSVAPARKEAEEAPEKSNEDKLPQANAATEATAAPNHGMISHQSEAVLNFQRSFTLLTEEEKQRMYAQVVTPSTGWRTPATGIPTRESLPAAANYFVQPQPMHHVPFYNQSVQQYNQASYTSRIDQNVDPLQAIMSKPRLLVFKEFIKDLATAAIVATDVIESKTSATKKMQDPTNENHIPRSIRNKNFTLTTIPQFQDHPRYKELKMKAADICAQYKANLTETVRELATCEITWLKILRVQQILQPIQQIIATLVFQTERTVARPSFPALVQANTIYFFIFYWLIQLNKKLVAANQSNTSYVDFLGLPSIDILATAATILITNSPQAVANVIECLNKQETDNTELDWDQSNAHAGYYVNTIVTDLQDIFNATVIDNSLYQQSLKTAKIAEAQTIAFANKLRTKTATELTNTTLNKVTVQNQMDSATEKDLQRRQQELEASLKTTRERLQVVAKRSEQQEKEQKNSPGSSSAQRPSQLKPNDKKPPTSKRLYHSIWAPPVEKETVTHNPEPTSNAPTEASTKPTSTAKPTNKAKPTEEEAKKAKNPNKKKRKFRKQPK